MTPNLEVLGSLVKDLHHGLSNLFYIMLPVAVLFSVVFGYLKSGDSNYPDIIKRSFVAALLLASFPEVSNLILDICDGLALKIDNMSGIETFMRMAEEKSRSYAVAKNVLLLKFDDLFMAILSFGSFLLLLLARYITVALYYFYWVLLSVCAPLMILCYVFPKTAGITANLYKGLIEVALWKVIWAIMSAMLTSLSFGNIYQTDGSYLTLIVMNFVIAIAMLFTPMIVRSLIGEGVQATAQTIGTTAALAAVALPTRIATVHQVSREMISNTRSYASQKFQNIQSTFRPKGS
ncbi:MAG: hypothetical protein ACK4VO_04095 [Pseudobdellovibrio sp.]|tara:strand:- start:155587 stop:156462 length:876 start_codon:yes stop_codon:yes gene_type:complete